VINSLESQIVDNRPGIQKEALKIIFIPLFTTKPGGSDIGLSLSRQIMHLHHGSISAASEIGPSYYHDVEILIAAANDLHSCHAVLFSGIGDALEKGGEAPRCSIFENELFT